MTRALDVLGWMKWPSVFVVTLFPLLAYFLGNWPGYWAGEARALYGPAVVGRYAVALAHPNRERPTDSVAPVAWRVHLDERGPFPSGVALAYGSAPERPPETGWLALTARQGWEWSGALPPVTAPRGAVIHIWVALRDSKGGTSHRSWPVGSVRP